jgi:hypothetical protein
MIASSAYPDASPLSRGPGTPRPGRAHRAPHSHRRASGVQQRNAAPHRSIPIVRNSTLARRGAAALALILSCSSGTLAQTAEIRNGLDDDLDGYIDEFTSGSYFVGLGDLPGGDIFSLATRVSNPVGPAGPVVVGESRTAAGRAAFRWTIAGGIQGLGGSSWIGTDVSHDGTVIVGNMPGPAGSQGFRWTETGGLIPIGSPRSGAPTEAEAVSGDGALAFGGEMGFGGMALFWTASGAVQAVLHDTGQNHMVAPSFDGSIAHVNSVLCCGNRRQYRWTPLTGPVQISFPLGEIRDGTSDASTVVGFSYRGGGVACRWSPVAGVLAIGPGGGTIVHAVSSDASRIVGQSGGGVPEAVVFSSATGPTHPIDYGFGFVPPSLFCNPGEPDAPVRVATLLSGAGVMPPGWTLVSANGVSPDGEYIVGEGINPQGRTEAWLARIVINRPPVGHAGADQTVPEGIVVVLDGTGSADPNEEPLAHQWTQIAGPTVVLSNPQSATPTFSAPQVLPGGATLTFELVVSDAAGLLSADTVDVTVVNVNNVPAAMAGENQAVAEAGAVTLDGALSYDLDGDALTYSWAQTGGTPVVLNLADPTRPTFSAPLVGELGETLTFELTVADWADSSHDSVNVLVENINHDPVSNAGTDLTRDESSLVTLDGSASADPDSDALTYVWLQVSGPPVLLTGAGTAAPSFTAPAVGPGGAQLLFSLCVGDGQAVNCDDVRVSVQDTNSPPNCSLARASVQQLWPPTHKMVPITILGVSDPDNQNILITITGVTQDEALSGLGDGDSSPDAVLQGSTVLLRAERACGGNGRVYRVSFRADDGLGGTCEGTVRLCVPHSMTRAGAVCVEDAMVVNSTTP